MRTFADRRAAGQALAEHLTGLLAPGDLKPGHVVLLGLPRGGVPVAAQVATALRAPLDVLLVRKLGLPGRPELAVGAVAAVGGVLRTVRNEDVLLESGLPADVFDELRAEQVQVLRERAVRYRGPRAPLPVQDRTVIVVDDGLATGATLRAALAALVTAAPARVVVAVPTAPAGAGDQLRELADVVVCLDTPRRFSAVGRSYLDFSPVSDDEVRTLLGVG